MQLTKLLALLSLTISINAATTQKCTGTELAGINLGSKTEILVCCNNAVGGAAGEPTATGTDCRSSNKKKDAASSLLAPPFSLQLPSAMSTCRGESADTSFLYEGGSPDYTESPTVGTCNDPDRTIPLCCAASVNSSLVQDGF